MEDFAAPRNDPGPSQEPLSRAASEQESSSSRSDAAEITDRDTVSDLVFVVDDAGRLAGLLAGEPKMFGARAEECVGAPLTRSFPPKLAEAIGDACENARAARGADPVLCRLDLDGRARTLSISASPAAGADAAGKTVVTVRPRVVRSMPNGMGLRFSDLANKAKSLIIVTDTRGRIIWVNEAFCRKSGYSLAEVEGKTPGAVVGAEAPESEVRARLRDAIAKVRPLKIRLKNRARDGSIYWVDDDVQPFFDETGKHCGFTAIQTDITELVEANERLQNIIEGARAGTWEYDTLTNRVTINRIFAEQLGYDHAELNPMDLSRWLDGIHPDDLEGAKAGLRDLRDGRKRTLQGEIRMRRKTGEWIWVEYYGSVVGHDDTGRMRTVFGVQKDISARRNARAQIEDAEREVRAAGAARDTAEQRFAHMIELSSDWIWEQDAEGRFTFISEGMRRTYRVDPAIFIGKTRAEVFGDRGREYWETLDELQRKREPIFNYVYPCRLPGSEDRERWLQIDGIPVYDRDGVFEGYRGIGADVTEIYEVKQAAERANKAKSEFLASVSHELRTPLSGVIGLAQILESRETDPDKRQTVSAIRQSGETLVRTLSDLLDLSKIEAGKLELETVPFVPAELGETLRHLHGAHCATKGLEFDVFVGSGMDTPRLGDPHRVTQIVNNLINNAIKFTESGGVSVTMKAASTGPVVLEVRDTGVGMTPEQADRVFQPYQQADVSTARQFGGTGLGLSIVKMIVEMMQGDIAVESTPGQGTRITVSLPLPVSDVIDTGQGDAQTASIAGLRILACDDSAVNRKLLDLILDEEGAEVVMACDGQQVVDSWRSGAFDIYLFDISMPEKDGVTALAEIRALEGEHGVEETPAIAVTAFAMSHQVAELLAAGFDTVISKPFDRAALVASIRLLAD